MSANGKLRDLGLTPYDDLFSTDAMRAEAKAPHIQEIPLELIDPFPDHPFQVNDDEDMAKLVDSIRTRGLITPVILRPKEDGRYEIISGHRRKRACELAQRRTVSAEVRDMDRDEAIILMVESNLQRSVILPSEKAFAYKMRLDAMKRQGQRTDLTSGPLGTKLGERADEQLAEEVGESARQIQRYVRLTNLEPELLKLVDEERIALRPAVEISYLSPEYQSELLETISSEDATPSLAQAIKMRKFAEEGRLNEDVIFSIMTEQKPNQKDKISFKAESLRKYLPANISEKDTEAYVIKALAFYRRHLERKRDYER